MKLVKGKFIGIAESGKKIEGEFEHQYFFKRPPIKKTIKKIKIYTGLIDVQILEME